MAKAPAGFIIQKVDPRNTGPVLAFHKKNLTVYLWPRNEEYFNRLAVEGHLFEAIEKNSGKIVGVCYVVIESGDGDGKDQGEFGGVYVSFRSRLYGIAKILGIVSISNFFVYERPEGRLIAHVHKDNPEPRPLLKEELGFVFVNQMKVPPEADPPESLPRNKKGVVVGDVFEFKIPTLLNFADWIDRFGGVVTPRRGDSVPLEIQILGFAPDEKADTAMALRDISGKRRS